MVKGIDKAKAAKAVTKKSTTKAPKTTKVKEVKVETPTFISNDMNAGNMLADIVWKTKRSRGWSKYDEDVKDASISTSIHKSKDGSTYTTVTITFRNKVQSKITTTGYVAIGICKNRLYFKESNHIDGYKVTERSGYTSGFAFKFISGSDDELLRPFLRQEFNVKYDDFQELYYIEVDKSAIS